LKPLVLSPRMTEAEKDLAPLGSRLRRGLAWSVAGATFNQGSTVLVNIVAANLFGPDLFGRYAAVQSTTATAANVAVMGTGYTAAKYAAELRSLDRERAGRVLGLCRTVAVLTAGLTALLVFAGAGWIASHLLREAELAGALRLAAGAVFFSVLSWYQMGALSGLEAFPSLAKGGIASGCVYAALCLTGARLGGLIGLVSAVAVSATIQWLLLAALLGQACSRQSIQIRWRGASRERSVFWKFGIPAALPSFTTMPGLWLSGLVLLAHPGGYREMALYTVAATFRTVVLFVPRLVDNVGLSLLNSQVGLKDPVRYRSMARLNLATTATAVLASAVAIAVAGRWLLRLFGEGYDAAYPALLLLLLASVVEALWYFVSQVASSREQMWSLFFGSTLPRDVLIVLLALALIPRFGAQGLAAASLLAWGAALVLAAGVVGIRERLVDPPVAHGDW
jgi:O-antigen/teichoic acid export membrane protein